MSDDYKSILKASNTPFIRERLNRLRTYLKINHLDAFYLRRTPNIAWITGFEQVFDEEDAHALLVTYDAAFLHSDSRYSLALRSRVADKPFEILDKSGKHLEVLVKALQERVEKPTSAQGEALARSLREICTESFRIGIEDSLSLREFRDLELQASSLKIDGRSIELVETSQVIEGLRETKDAYEIACMRKAQEITDAGFAFIRSFIRPNMTELEVQRALDNFMFEAGAEGLAFPTIVATGSHAASPHAIPGQSRLEEGQCVVMDFGARYRGYCSDMTRTLFIGSPTEEMTRAWHCLVEANETCESLLHVGLTGFEAHECAEKILDCFGFKGKMGHALGHSLGLEIHENPSLSTRNKAPLSAGITVTVEPGIYLDGRFGMRLEDFGVITDKGFEVITCSTHEMVIIEPC